ncbi:MAG: hypothetical protein MJ198_08455 [Bacteroidales bacterium]|nr:hypothetical protein [Bacteroidales bacterium]
MKTSSKTLSSFLSAAVWADGEYDEFEKEFVAQVGEILEVKTLCSDLESAIKATEKMTEDELSSCLEEAAKQVDPEEKEGVLTLCLQMMCADAFLANDEVENFFAFAEILGVDESTASSILDEFVDEEEDLIIEE